MFIMPHTTWEPRDWVLAVCTTALAVGSTGFHCLRVKRRAQMDGASASPEIETYSPPVPSDSTIHSLYHQLENASTTLITVALFTALVGGSRLKYMIPIPLAVLALQYWASSEWKEHPRRMMWLDGLSVIPLTIGLALTRDEQHWPLLWPGLICIYVLGIGAWLRGSRCYGEGHAIWHVLTGLGISLIWRSMHSSHEVY